MVRNENTRTFEKKQDESLSPDSNRKRWENMWRYILPNDFRSRQAWTFCSQPRPILYTTPIIPLEGLYESNRTMTTLKEQDFLGPGDVIAEGDTYILHGFLPPDLAEVAFENLRKEVKWNTMMHRGRLNRISFRSAY